MLPAADSTSIYWIPIPEFISRPIDTYTILERNGAWDGLPCEYDYSQTKRVNLGIGSALLPPVSFDIYCSKLDTMLLGGAAEGFRYVRIYNGGMMYWNKSDVSCVSRAFAEPRSAGTNGQYSRSG